MKRSADYPLTTRPIMGFSDEYAADFFDPMHSHERSQVSFSESGVVSVITETSSFILPPRRAIWIPAGMMHEVHCRSAHSSYTLYIDPRFDWLPQRCRVFEVSELVKALIYEVGHFSLQYDVDGREGQLARLLIEEIKRMPSTPSELVMPRDPRLLRVCRELLEDPSDGKSIDEWTTIAGMGRRTFTRLFREQTGAGFAVWRQHMRVMDAISRMARGQSITTVALDVGYDSPSAFTAMFHRIFGVPPSAYITQTKQLQEDLDMGLSAAGTPI